MSWAQLDDKMPRHPNVRALSDAAFRLHVAAICHCNEYLTDGVLTGEDQRDLTRLTSADHAAVVRELCDAGLWRKTTSGFELRDFLDWNASRSVRLAQRDAAAKRMANLRNVRPNKRRTNGARSPEVPDPSPSPTPSPKTETETETDPRSARRDAPKAPPPPDATPLVAFVLSTWPDVRTVPEAAWRDACPALDLLAEARKAHAWELSQPASRRKRDHRRFLDGWLRRAQERAATARLDTRQPPPRATSPAATKEDFDGGPQTI